MVKNAYRTLMLSNLQKYDIILASNSPRRRELLSQIGVNFTCRTIQGIDESYPDSLPAHEVAQYVASKKADAYSALITDNTMVITSDTVVILGDKVLGKPHTKDEAHQMLASLAAHTHSVVTGVVIATATRREAFSVTSEVDFAPLTDEEIDYYIENYRPMDKAGAYGIQEWIGNIGIKQIRGSFYNVMGLPTHRLYEALKTF